MQSNPDSNTLSKHTVSFGLSLAICSIANALLVVVKETSPAVVAALKAITGHQWVSHAVLVLALFFLCGWLLALPNGGKGVRMAASRLLGIIVSGVVAGGLTIMGFYTLAD